MTNGQMAPTTLINQKTLTTPHGRSEKMMDILCVYVKSSL